ncbi:FAD-binding oxidoreductase [Candidatus Pelagibacter sp.]|nr:FAD-binding oxidoreductase [Candidatus Pelagibacter sp.]
MKKFDVAIIGNGILGTLLAYNLKKFSNVCIIGPSNRNGSASTAAGAMLNVFGEVDYDKASDDYLEQKIKVGYQSQKLWKKFEKKIKNKDDIFCADNTIIFKSKNSTPLEKKCFRAIVKYAKLYNVYSKNHAKLKQLKKNSKFKNIEAFLIKGEGAVNTKKLFDFLDNEIRGKITNFNSEAKSLKKKNYYHIKLGNSQTISAKKIILCAGSFSKKILKNSGLNILDIYYGVGSALELFDTRKILENKIPKRTVLRSPNRGSTCGIHIVPRSNNNYYLGAGSNIVHKPNYNHRSGTLNYLFNCAEKEIFGNFTKVDCKPVIGFRPISFDGKPMIGPVNKDVFVATGTKRDGLTLSPLIVDYIKNWLKDSKFVNKNFEKWLPNREPISYGDQSFSTEVYINNKIAGLLEHNDIDKKNIKRVKKELLLESKKFHKKIIKLKKLKNTFGVHPEILNTF